METGIKREIIASVRAARGAERRARIREWARLTGRSESTIYRWAQNGQRKTRSDAGERRAKISDQAWMLMVAARIQNGYTAAETVAHALANGWIRESIHPKTFSTWLRKAGLGGSRMQDTGKQGLSFKTIAYRRFEAARPNDLHQIDLTEIPRYFISGGNAIGWESVLTAGKNKPGAQKPRIHLYAIVDDHSRCCYARLYTTKEVTGWIDFCHRAWSGDGFALRGCPDILYTDNDSAAKSNLFLGFLGRVGTEIQTHEVGSPQAKGKVERLLGTLQGALTRALRPLIDQGGVDLDGANRILLGIVAQYNRRPHSTTGVAPEKRYANLSAQDVREMPAIPRERYLFDTFTPMIRPDWSVRIGGLSYQLPREEPYTSRIGEKIRIDAHHHEAERHILIAIIDGQEHEVPAEQVVPDRAGDYKSAPKSDADRLIEEARNIDLSEAGFDPTLIYTQDDADPQVVPLPAAPPPVPEPSMTRRQIKLRLVEDGVTFDIDRAEALMGDQDTFTDAEYAKIKRRLA